MGVFFAALRSKFTLPILAAATAKLKGPPL